jgi:cyclopropane fatty-acyl-phospholipid synthase-like methyltransferase
MDVAGIFKRPEFPRSAKYDPDWMLENQMGPNALWLMEWLCETLNMKPGMRVLDLGCGKAISSIFLAREFAVRVWAADLWISPDTNWRRVVAAGIPDLVCPIKAEAHALPFAQGFFDAAVCVDAYQYFGTDELYLDYLARFVKPGGALGVVVVGLMKELSAGLPACLTEPQKNGKVFWEASCRCFKTREFWSSLWSGSSSVTDVAADTQRDGWRHWRDFEQAIEASGKGIFPSDSEALDKDCGNTIGFLRLTARRTAETEVNLYDPSLGAKVGADR